MRAKLQDAPLLVVVTLLTVLTAAIYVTSCEVGETGPATILSSSMTAVPAMSPPVPFNGVVITPPDEVFYYHPAGLRWLTEEEKNTAIRIALSTPTVIEKLKGYSVYQTQLGWIAIQWADAERTVMGINQRFPYDVVERGVQRSGVVLSEPGVTPCLVTAVVPESAIIYPEVSISFGETKRNTIAVTIDLDAHEAVRVETVAPPPGLPP